MDCDSQESFIQAIIASGGRIDEGWTRKGGHDGRIVMIANPFDPMIPPLVAGIIKTWGRNEDRWNHAFRYFISKTGSVRFGTAFSTSRVLSSQERQSLFDRVASRL